MVPERHPLSLLTLSVGLLLYSTGPSKSQGHFTLTEEVTQCYHECLNLRLSKARNLSYNVALKDPENLWVELLHNYIDFLDLFIGEEKEKLPDYREQTKKRIQRIKDGDMGSPYFLFSQAQILLQSALIKLKFKEYISAFNEVTRAFDLLEYNERAFPDFQPNHISIGLMRAMVGTIPDKYKWGARLLGLNGSISDGLEQMRMALENESFKSHLLYNEGLVMYAFALLHLAHEEEGAWERIQSSNLDEGKSLLATFIKANLALRTKHNDEAIRILTQRPSGPDYLSFDYLEYMLGQGQLQNLNPQASCHFLTFVKNYGGKNYIKDAYKKLAWCDVLFDGGKKVEYYRQQCLRHGWDQVDADIAADVWASQGRRELPDLLKARLLFDGGYFHRSLAILDGLNPEGWSGEETIEWYYRRARVEQALGESDNALHYFFEVLRYQGTSRSYMLGNAALQCGYIYEEMGNEDEAFVYYTMARNMEVDQYANGINQKAKAGMDRVRK